jgi:hypothetical protein
MRERMDQPVPGRLQAGIGIDVLSGLRQPPLEVPPVRVPVRPPQVGRQYFVFPSGDGGFVELEEDALAPVLGRDRPRGRGARVSGASLRGRSPTRSTSSIRVNPTSALTCHVIEAWPELAGSWWISDDREAVRYARFRYHHRETIVLVAMAVADGEISPKDGYALMSRMASAGRHLRLPASATDLARQ